MQGKRGYVIVTLCMLIPCLLMLVSDAIAWVCFLFYTLIIGLGLLYFIIPLMIIMNIAAFFAVMANKEGLSVVLTLCGGFIGGFIAANTVNKDYKEGHEIGFVFIAGLFTTVIYPLWSYAMFEFDIHAMLM